MLRRSYIRRRVINSKKHEAMLSFIAKLNTECCRKEITTLVSKNDITILSSATYTEGDGSNWARL